MNSKDIAKAYDLLHEGKEREILHFGSLESQSNNVILWTKSKELYKNIKKGILLAPVEFISLPKEKGVTYLYSKKSPRLIFAKVLNDFFGSYHPDDYTNHVKEHRKNKSIKIGDNCFIGKNVKIGEGTEILHNTSIFSNTVIANNCLINSNCSIGTPGLGFEYDGDEIVKFPQLGGVYIEEGVEIGPSTTIRRGALDDTKIGAFTKIGALTNIGHNCIVGKQCILTCQIVLGGSTKIGDKVFMGINSITKNKVKIGNNVTIGMGAVVLQDIPSGSVAIGFPAKVTINEK